jgi:endoglycosylceramidase
MRMLVALLLTAGCQGPYAARFAPVDSDGAALRDAEGRTLIFHGVNYKSAGIFDVTFSDGRAPREALATFTADDAASMRHYGFNLVRVPLSWSAIEPMPGQFATDYLDRVAAVVDLLRAQNVRVLLDFHEDGFSKEICEDGAPLWAIDPPPPPLPGGPVAGPDCHTSSAALAAFSSFFDDANMLEERFAEMVQQVALRFKDDQDVIAYELFNEPITSDDQALAFHTKVANALRAVDRKKLFVFEPPATRNFTDSALVSPKPFPVAGGVYAVHIYTAIFGHDTQLMNGTYPPLLQASISGARDEATAWGTPLMVTEFGLGPQTTNATQWIGHALDDLDAVGASWTWWHWKDPSPGGWGLWEPQPDGSFLPRTALLQAVSRPYAQAIGGDVDSISFDGSSLTVKLHGHAGVPARHDIFWNGATPNIACDGKPAQPSSVDAASSLYVVACGGSGAHTLTFGP